MILTRPPILPIEHANARNDPRIRPWLRTTRPTNQTEQQMWWEEKGRKQFWVLSEFGLQVGLVGLTDIEQEPLTKEFSLLIYPRYQKKGYGLKALKLLLEYGFFKYHYEKIIGETYAYEIDAKIKNTDSSDLRNVKQHGVFHQAFHVPHLPLCLMNPAVHMFAKLNPEVYGSTKNKRSSECTIHSIFFGWTRENVVSRIGL